MKFDNQKIIFSTKDKYFILCYNLGERSYFLNKHGEWKDEIRSDDKNMFFNTRRFAIQILKKVQGKHTKISK